MRQILTLLILTLSQPIWADNLNDAKLAVVQKLYAEDGEGVQWPLLQYATPTLRQTLDNSTHALEQNDYPCLEYDPVWDSQDPVYGVEVRTTIEPDGKVKASFEQYGKLQTVYFDVDCSATTCRIANIYNVWDGEIINVKQNLDECITEVANMPPNK